MVLTVERDRPSQCAADLCEPAAMTVCLSGGLWTRGWLGDGVLTEA
jgi:hypothetical protein